MSFTRAQVNAAKEALGLDIDLTHSVQITPDMVHTQVVALVDGHPDVRDGRVGMLSEMHVIEEAADVDA